MECIFCRIVAGTAAARLIYEDDLIIAFHDIKPAAPVHVLIIPKKHIPSMNEIGQEDLAAISRIHNKVQVIANKLGIAGTGYRLVANCGADAGQVVPHLHYHLLGGKKLSLTH
ncbi:histidine triad nucleotide-binding protein [Gorillibacterium massiliense]|uniref:histidine triad nucleotide-binding protein n=1 Tax=Gorillibacterium massiliense TaxID=1280390 RepID=UPI0004BB13C6|nr:histidine triad nucleotide-binding protein [Gorillibacterium massiliense]